MKGGLVEVRGGGEGGGGVAFPLSKPFLMFILPVPLFEKKIDTMILRAESKEESVKGNSDQIMWIREISCYAPVVK